MLDRCIWVWVLFESCLQVLREDVGAIVGVLWCCLVLLVPTGCCWTHLGVVGCCWCVVGDAGWCLDVARWCSGCWGAVTAVGCSLGGGVGCCWCVVVLLGVLFGSCWGVLG